MSGWNKPWRGYFAAILAYVAFMAMAGAIIVLVCLPVFAYGPKLTVGLCVGCLLILLSGHCLGSFFAGKYSLMHGGKLSVPALVTVLLAYLFVDLNSLSKGALQRGKVDFVVPEGVDIALYGFIVFTMVTLAKRGVSRMWNEWEDED